MKMIVVYSCIGIIVVIISLLVVRQFKHTSKGNDADLFVINELKKAGSDLSKPHDVEFHFISAGKENLESMIKEFKSVDYKITQIFADENEKNKKEYFVDVVKTMIVSEETIIPESALMSRLADKYKVTFDGWGASIVK